MLVRLLNSSFLTPWKSQQLRGLCVGLWVALTCSCLSYWKYSSWNNNCFSSPFQTSIVHLSLDDLLQSHGALLLVLCSCSILQVENLSISPGQIASEERTWLQTWTSWLQASPHSILQPYQQILFNQGPDSSLKISSRWPGAWVICEIPESEHQLVFCLELLSMAMTWKMNCPGK